jgi:hypothetical protein
MPTFNIYDSIKFDEIMPKIDIDHMLPKYNLGSYMNIDSQFRGHPESAEPAPDPLSDEEIEERVAAYRASLEAR